MEFELFVDSPCEIDLLIQYLKNAMIDEVEMSQVFQSEDDVFSGVRCQYFSFLLDKEETIGLDVINAENDIDVKQNIQIAVINSTYEVGIHILIRVLNNFLKMVEGDYILLSNGSIEIVVRRKGEINISNRADYVPVDEFDLF